MNDEIRYYRGLHKVKVVNKSEGYWTVEAQEDFEDYVDEKRVRVKTREQRIVPPTMLFKDFKLPPPVKEHTYELKMERKLKRMVARVEKSSQGKTK